MYDLCLDFGFIINARSLSFREQYDHQARKLSYEIRGIVGRDRFKEFFDHIPRWKMTSTDESYNLISGNQFRKERKICYIFRKDDSLFNFYQASIPLHVFRVFLLLLDLKFLQFLHQAFTQLFPVSIMRW